MKCCVQIEVCGATAKAHGWDNAELLPGVKVNTDAMARTTELVQEGFVQDLGIGSKVFAKPKPKAFGALSADHTDRWTVTFMKT
jgi:hypothetical protein